MKGSAISVGVRTHSGHGSEEGGWAAYVVLGGPVSEPRLLFRGRMQLWDSRVEGSNQPFHRAGVMFPFHRCEPMDFKTAEAFVKRCRKSSRDMAGRALNDIASAHGALNAYCVLTGPERALPPLREILTSHGLMHAAERAFFRDAVRDAAAQRKIATEIVRENDLPALEKRLPGTEATRRDTLKVFGKQVGSPWAQDEKFAATAAWLGLDLLNVKE
ncbi:MAG: hypothetical protein ISS15_00915 [Alphaproteobacteria bacterium]|nr:hypothetical protein [Alphaproteobacteria bacterium]MBL6937247.1 hypothetical protein [Alphaproteobacteria bacterium]MBL7096191.1 hypothetical protein [Alphaproteobacteria bacterium]